MKAAIFRAFAAFAATLALCAPAMAQGFPSKPIRIVIPFAVGGTADPMARMLADVIGRRTGAKFVIELYPTDQVSPDMEMPRWIIFLCVPLGSYLMCFRFLQVAWSFWFTGELPHHDPGHVEGVVESPQAAREVRG